MTSGSSSRTSGRRCRSLADDDIDDNNDDMTLTLTRTAVDYRSGDDKSSTAVRRCRGLADNDVDDDSSSDDMVTAVMVTSDSSGHHKSSKAAVPPRVRAALIEARCITAACSALEHAECVCSSCRLHVALNTFESGVDESRYSFERYRYTWRCS